MRKSKKEKSDSNDHDQGGSSSPKMNYSKKFLNNYHNLVKPCQSHVNLRMTCNYIGSGSSSNSADDVLYICSASGLSTSSFSIVEKAKNAVMEFLIQMEELRNVPKSLYEEICDFLVNLKTRNLKWSVLKFQLLTFPKDTSNGELIALQAQLNMCPEMRPINKLLTTAPPTTRQNSAILI